MTVKMSGAEWKEYYTASWPEGQWHEEEEITIDGEEAGADDDLTQARMYDEKIAKAMMLTDGEA